MAIWPFRRKPKPTRYTVHVLAHPDVTVTAAWTVYAGVKAMRRMGRLEPLAPGLTSPFDEECYARDAIGEYWAVQPVDKRQADPYLQLLADVRAAGLVREYVWRFARDPLWPEPAGLRSDAFDGWWAAHGPTDHTPLTLGFATPI